MKHTWESPKVLGNKLCPHNILMGRENKAELQGRPNSDQYLRNQRTGPGRAGEGQGGSGKDREG